MKRRLCVLLIGLSLMVTACGSGGNAAGAGTDINEAEIDNDETAEGTDSDITTVGNDTDINTADTSETQNENDKTAELGETAADTENNDGTLYVVIYNPSEEYYIREGYGLDSENSNAGKSIKLNMLTEEANDITDTEKWFNDNGLEIVDRDVIYDDRYRYVLAGDDGYSRYIMYIYDRWNGDFLGTYDFSQFRYGSEYIESDYDYIEQRIWWVQSVGDILYVAIAHNTYTESCPNNGYIVAIDMNDAAVIWKSAPCMTNAYTFAIIDNTIVSGYGFTAEPDNLNLIDINNGKLIEQVPIKSMAEYIICIDDILYVRTYNTNYTFQIVL